MCFPTLPPRDTTDGALQVFSFVDLPGLKPKVNERKAGGLFVLNSVSPFVIYIYLINYIYNQFRHLCPEPNIVFNCRCSVQSTTTSWSPSLALLWGICRQNSKSVSAAEIRQQFKSLKPYIHQCFGPSFVSFRSIQEALYWASTTFGLNDNFKDEDQHKARSWVS